MDFEQQIQRHRYQSLSILNAWLRVALLLSALASTAVCAQYRQIPPASPVDAVAVYVVPTDEMPEQVAGTIARTLSKATGLWIKATMWTPSGDIESFPGTNQYPAEAYFPIGLRSARLLPEASPRTYFIILTTRDINSRVQNFRFVYSLHSPMQNTSVLSAARLTYNVDGTAATAEVVTTRLAKMLLRIVGEMRLGWKRSTDPTDLMYAPIMSIEDVDRLTLNHTPRKQQP